MIVAPLQDGVARRGTTYGTVFLPNLPTATTSAGSPSILEHEARHSNQWAASTLLAGPVAFPALFAAGRLAFLLVGLVTGYRIASRRRLRLAGAG
jgi:hypothetical protein